MSPQQLAALRRRLTKLWVMSPEKLWLASIALRERGHWQIAFWLKQLNTLLYHNSLAPGATVSPDVLLGHYSHGIVINSNVVIGRRVKIWHNVTLTAGRTSRGDERSATGPRAQIIVEDDVSIGTNAVVIAPRGATLRIGSGARIGAGTVVTSDVPAGATVVAAPARMLLGEASSQEDSSAQQRERREPSANGPGEELSQA